MTRQSLGRQILERLIKDVDQRGLVEFRPRQEGNTLHLILAPNKKEGGAHAKEKPHASPKPAPPPAPQGGAQTA
jgi:translation initiation factor IF-3